MNRKFQIIASTTAASVLALSALAQDTTAPKTEKAEYSRDGVRQMRRADRLNGAAKASDIIGMTVNNYQNEKLGKVEDLAIDVESGRIVQVILSTGGFLGIGDTLTAVPAGALHHDVAKKVLHLDVDKEKLKSAPKFEMSNWAEHSDTNHLSQVYRYYGDDASLGFIQYGEANGDVKTNADGTPGSGATRKADGTWDTLGNRRADGTWDADRNARNQRFMIPVSRLGQVQKASKLIGMPVKNLQDEKLGKVENLLLDMTSGRVVAVVVSSGGFLGMGDELSGIPSAALRFTTDRDCLQLDTTKESLGNAPHFKASEWPSFDQPAYTEGVYRAYRVEPYFGNQSENTARNVRDREDRLSTESDRAKSQLDNTARDLRDREDQVTGKLDQTAKQADNTVRNVRDRNNNSLTPLNQGNSKADVATTAQIRKEIIATKDMSVNGKNVKVITIDGRVTLRGPVGTSEEKRLIGEIAGNLVQIANVDNQLEVK